jgi:hypothetical protein
MKTLRLLTNSMTKGTTMTQPTRLSGRAIAAMVRAGVVELAGQGGRGFGGSAAPSSANRLVSGGFSTKGAL